MMLYSPEHDPGEIAFAAGAANMLTAGELPWAFRYLRIGLAETPYSSLLRDGLAVARSQVVYPADPAAAARLRPDAEWWPGCAFHPVLVLAGFFAWCVVCTSLTRWLQVRRHRWLVIAGLCLPLAAIPPGNALVRWSRSARDAAAPPVVIATNVALREGNGLAYPVRAELPRGVECRRVGRRGEWVQVEFASGLTGWVPQTATSEY